MGTRPWPQLLRRFPGGAGGAGAGRCGQVWVVGSSRAGDITLTSASLAVDLMAPWPLQNAKLAKTHLHAAHRIVPSRRNCYYLGVLHYRLGEHRVGRRQGRWCRQSRRSRGSLPACLPRGLAVDRRDLGVLHYRPGDCRAAAPYFRAAKTAPCNSASERGSRWKALAPELAQRLWPIPPACPSSASSSTGPTSVRPWVKPRPVDRLALLWPSSGSFVCDTGETSANSCAERRRRPCTHARRNCCKSDGDLL